MGDFYLYLKASGGIEFTTCMVGVFACSADRAAAGASSEERAQPQPAQPQPAQPSAQKVESQDNSAPESISRNDSVGISE